MYRFTLPQAAYEVEWTYEGLSDFLQRGRSKVRRKLGTTLVVYRDSWPVGPLDVIDVRLYDTVIAEFFSDNTLRIPFGVNGHGSQATTAWLQLIVPVFVERVDGRYNVAGRTFTA